MEAQKVILRDWKEFDASRLAEIAGSEKIYENMRDGFPKPYTLLDAKKHIERALDPKNTAILKAITYHGDVVGSIGAFFGQDIYRLNAEIAYFIAEEVWGKGIASEAIYQMSAYLFESTEIHRIEATPFCRNMGSRRALEKSGFKLEGVLKENVIKNGRMEDSCIYGKLRYYP